VRCSTIIGNCTRVKKIKNKTSKLIAGCRAREEMVVDRRLIILAMTCTRGQIQYPSWALVGSCKKIFIIDKDKKFDDNKGRVRTMVENNADLHYYQIRSA